MPALGNPKPLCVDCKIRPMKLYCRCWECLKEFEKQNEAINILNGTFRTRLP